MRILRPPAPLSLLLALVLGAACAGLLACGAKSNPHLLSAARADRLTSELDDVRNTVDGGDCAGAKSAVQKLLDEVASLPSDTDPGLRRRLQDGAQNLRARAVQDCQQTTTTPTVTETTPTVTQTATQTTTTQTQTDTTPTQTTTTPTQTSTTPTQTTTTPDSGGSTAPAP